MTAAVAVLVSLLVSFTLDADDERAYDQRRLETQTRKGRAIARIRGAVFTAGSIATTNVCSSGLWRTALR